MMNKGKQVGGIFCFIGMLLVSHLSMGQIKSTEYPNAVREGQQLQPREIDGLITVCQKLIKDKKGDSASLILLEALKQSCAIRYQKGIDSALNDINFWLSQREPGDYHAKIMSQAVACVSPIQKENLFLARLYIYYGFYFQTRLLFYQAMVQQQKALKVLPKNNSAAVMHERAKIYIYLSGLWIYLSGGDSRVSSQWLNKAEVIVKKQKDTHSMIAIHRNRGVLFLEQKKLDSAYFYTHAAYLLGKKNPGVHPADCRCMNSNTTYLGLILIEQGRGAEALKLVQEEKRLLEIESVRKLNEGYIQDSVNQYLLYFSFLEGYAYLTLKEYKKVEQILVPLLKTANKTKIKDLQQNVLAILAEMYGKTGQYKKGYQEQAEFINLKMQNDQVEKGKAMALYFSTEKERELAGKQLLIVRQRNKIREKNFWIAGASIGALLLATSLFALYRSNRNKQRFQASSIINLQHEQEITRLQARVEGEEQERSRIAHELHDGIVSQLLALKLNLNELQSKNEQEIQSYELNDVMLQLEDATRDLRRTAHNLMPDLLLQQGLALSVASLCEKINRNTAVEVDFQAYGNLPRLPQDTELSLFRMLQELIQNVLKHADATTVMVQLSCRGALLGITVEDNGSGFQPGILQVESSNGMGLQNLRRRVDLLKGYMDIQSKKGKGTTVYLEFDLTHLV